MLIRILCRRVGVTWPSPARSSQIQHKLNDSSRRQMGTVALTNSQAVAEELKDAGLLLSKALIGDKWIGAIDGRTVSVNNPATGDFLTDVPFMGKKDTELAIDAAYRAFPAWSQKSGKERSNLLRKWFDLMMVNKEHLARLMTLEQGKPVQESLGEVSYGAGFVELYAEEAKRINGDIIQAPTTDKRLFVLRQPVGVVGAITPWNFPIAMITRKVAPALAAGCTIVVKPSEFTPLCATAIAKLALEAGIPPGVVNIVIGDAAQIGSALMESSKVRKFTFTGSTPVGKSLMASAAATVKKVSLELGGLAPCIVFDDADLDVAVEGALAGKYRNAGQTCVCVNSILVQDGIYDEFAKALTKAVLTLQVGNGLDAGVTQGPLINQKALAKVHSHVDDAIAKGAKVLVGGKNHSLGRTFYEPTVLGDATEDMKIFREEVFGPVAPLIRFKDEQDAIRMANDSEFGLASYLFTENISRGWRVAEALDFGMVGLNEGLISTEVAPFGGQKQSGLGREGSKYGLDEYIETHKKGYHPKALPPENLRSINFDSLVLRVPDEVLVSWKYAQALLNFRNTSLHAECGSAAAQELANGDRAGREGFQEFWLCHRALWKVSRVISSSTSESYQGTVFDEIQNHPIDGQNVPSKFSELPPSCADFPLVRLISKARQLRSPSCLAR